MKNFADYGIEVPKILLPKNTEISKWSVIACDQYTQDADYWKNVEKEAGTSPSTLNLILPEVYLSSPDKADRIKCIKEKMQDYLNSDVFADPMEGFVYVERKTAYGRTRKGLVCAIDLEDYEWKPFSKALIRATEATIVDRIPPRKEIRMGAPIESPHIMLLVNDAEKALVEKTGSLVKNNAPLYEGDLMQKSGHITGWAVNGKNLEPVLNALESIRQKNIQADGSEFMFAVGDGNHSLATAKAVWDEYKEKTGLTDSPVRYALVEIVNIFDEGLTFEPIHRVLFSSKADELVEFAALGLEGKTEVCKDFESLEKEVAKSKADFGFVFTKDGSTKYLLLRTSITELAVSRIQPLLDEFAKKENAEMDYIHGSDEVKRLGEKEACIAMLLPPIAKDSFFATISSRGPLPRKSFSMGEASEKRFYLECRRLFG